MRRFYSLLLMVLCCTGLFAKTKKAVYIIIDGVPADQIERLHTPAIFDIASRGAYGRAYTGGRRIFPDRYDLGDRIYQFADIYLV